MDSCDRIEDCLEDAAAENVQEYWAEVVQLGTLLLAHFYLAGSHKGRIDTPYKDSSLDA